MLYSEKEIIEIFKLMGLASPRERQHFKRMKRVDAEPEAEQTCLFIDASGQSSAFESEVKDAELEANPR